MHLDYHTYFTMSDSLDRYKIKDVWDSFKLTGCFDCFYSYYAVNKDKEYFLFCWSAVPEYIEDVVKSFNDTFKNIELILVDSVPVYYSNRNTDFSSSTVRSPNAKSALFSIKLNSKYSRGIRNYIWYIIHQLLRLLSLSEDSYQNDNGKFLFNNKERDFCTLVSNVNRHWYEMGYTYRGVEYPFSPENVLLLDDIDLCNKIFGELKGYTKKQTDLLFLLFYNSKLFVKTDLSNVIAQTFIELNIKKGDRAIYVNNLTKSFPILGLSISSYDSLLGNSSDYTIQKRFACSRSQVKLSSRLILEDTDCILLTDSRLTYVIKDGFAIVRRDNLINSCYGHSGKISGLEYSIYSGRCQKCVEKKSIVQVCEKHNLKYCNECFGRKSFVGITSTISEHEQRIFKALGISGIKY